MTRPREYPTRVATQIRIDPDLLARLHTAAEQRDVSVNFLITRAVTHYLDRLTPIDELTPGADQ